MNNFYQQRHLQQFHTLSVFFPIKLHYLAYLYLCLSLLNLFAAMNRKYQCWVGPITRPTAVLISDKNNNVKMVYFH